VRQRRPGAGPPRDPRMPLSEVGMLHQRTSFAGFHETRWRQEPLHRRRSNVRRSSAGTRSGLTALYTLLLHGAEVLLARPRRVRIFLAASQRRRKQNHRASFRGSLDIRWRTDDRVAVFDIHDIPSDAHVQIINRNGPIILAPLSMPLRFLGEIDDVLTTPPHDEYCIRRSLRRDCQTADGDAHAACGSASPAACATAPNLDARHLAAAKAADFSPRSIRAAIEAITPLPASVDCRPCLPSRQAGRGRWRYPHFAEVLAVANNWYIHHLSRAATRSDDLRGSSKRRLGNWIPAES
jgi:hypothetical protein